jgi:predicted nicotinamide N-methyase
MNPEEAPSPSLPSQDLWVQIEEIAHEQVIVEGRTFWIARPDESRRVLARPISQNDPSREPYLPYWAELWPAARMLAKAILRQPWPAGQMALEIGCGLGLPGLAALAMGLRVIFSDYDPLALAFADYNARRNGFEEFTCRTIDWHAPPDDLSVPVVLASDLIYELHNVEPLVGLIKKTLAPGGVCLLTNEDRVPSHVLRETLTVQGFCYSTQIMRAGEPGGRRVKGTLYRITHAR